MKDLDSTQKASRRETDKQHRKNANSGDEHERITHFKQTDYWTLLGKVIQRRLFFRLNDVDSLDEILVGNAQSVAAQSQHSVLYSHRLQLRAVHIVRATRQFLEVDITGFSHSPRMDLQNFASSIFIRHWKFNFPVKSPGAN